MSQPISVQIDAVQGLADELAGLAAALAADGQLCSEAAGPLWAALEGSPGYWAAGTATGWAGVLEVLAQRSSAVAATLSAACDSYRRAEVALARLLGGALVGRPR
jgi:hypothetical protein